MKRTANSAQPPADLEAAAARVTAESAKYDMAILELFRELVWEKLNEEGDPESLAKAIKLLFDIRRHAGKQDPPLPSAENNEKRLDEFLESNGIQLTK